MKRRRLSDRLFGRRISVASSQSGVDHPLGVLDCGQGHPVDRGPTTVDQLVPFMWLQKT